MTAVLRADARSSDFLNPIQLVEYTRFVAEEVRAGKYPFIEYDADARWHQRIYRDRRVDVWLISWLPSQGTQLHDHGGSAGSFTVLSGELSEAVFVASGPRAGTLRERVHVAGRSVGFDAQYVHDVRNTSDRPAVSVHAYSRPLTSMTYWDLDAGALAPIATLDTDDPEPEFVP
jgi:predicted metal-dependent enzyme (double-stranded beta helix superfamily)